MQPSDPDLTKPEKSGTSPDTGDDASWQRRLLPFMVLMIGGLAVFFFIASVSQLYYLQQRIEQGPALALDVAQRAGDSVELVHWRTLVTLEAHAVQQRYHQANVLLMSRVWTRYLGFVTGMILSLVGAAFVLGKLREPESKFDASTPHLKIAFYTTSPGLALTILGTVLMLTAMLTQTEIDVRDGPLYVSPIAAVATGKADSSLPPDFPTPMKDPGAALSDKLSSGQNPIDAPKGEQR